VEYDIDALIAFVNEQVDFHGQLIAQGRETNDARKVLRHGTILERYIQLRDVLENSRHRTKKPAKRLALTWEEVHDLPPELISELSVSDGDKLEFDIVQILDELGGVASLDRLLVALYRKTGEIHQRTWLNNRLYRMVQKEMLYSVPGKKGVYSSEPLSKEEAADLL
jgi:hypothetical protein